MALSNVPPPVAGGIGRDPRIDCRLRSLAFLEPLLEEIKHREGRNKSQQLALRRSVAPREAWLSVRGAAAASRVSRRATTDAGSRSALGVTESVLFSGSAIPCNQQIGPQSLVTAWTVVSVEECVYRTSL